MTVPSMPPLQGSGSGQATISLISGGSPRQEKNKYAWHAPYALAGTMDITGIANAKAAAYTVHAVPGKAKEYVSILQSRPQYKSMGVDVDRVMKKFPRFLS